jgi:hypothetical protein
MGIEDRKYRTQTYIAGGWTEDADAIEQLHKWNDSDHWELSFRDVHSLTSSKDSSRPCSIKHSLSLRMNVSKTFVLVVGSETKTLRKGSCQYCDKRRWDYMSVGGYVCSSGRTYDSRSFVEYECDLAIKANVRIVILYNSTRVEYNKCPEQLLEIPDAIHIAMKVRYGDAICWNYQAVKKAIESL